MLALGRSVVDLRTGEVTGARQARLTTRERTLLHRLARAPGKAVSRAQLFEAFGYHPSSRSRAVDKAVYTLRQKVEDDPNRPRHVVTAHGQGYVLHCAPLRVDPTLVSTGPLFGRVTELAALGELIVPGAGAVVVLEGPGGAGKTRLAAECVQRFGPRFEGGARFGDLSAVEHASSLALAVAHQLGVPVGSDPVATMAEALRVRGPMLLVLDNLEQVVAPAAEVLSIWRAAAPRHVLLCTSRRRLPLASHRRLRLGPLDDVAAVRLFRAQAPDAELEDDADIVALSRDVDGLPLALELAAGHSGALSVSQIRARLSHSVDMLADDAAGRPVRQRSLRACFGTTWDLLSGDGRRAMAALATFMGPFALTAAAGVLAAVGVEDLVAVVQDLVDVGLLRRGGARLSFPPLVRELAAEAGDARSRGAAERAHGRWFAGRVGLQGAAVVTGVPSLELAELEDLRAAHTRALERGDAEVAIGTAHALYALLEHVGSVPAAVPVLEAAVPLARGHRDEVVVLLNAGLARRHAGDGDRSLEWYREALKVARRRFDAASSCGLAAHQLAFSSDLLGWSLRDRGRIAEGNELLVESEQHYGTAARLAHEAEDVRAETHVRCDRLHLLARRDQWRRVRVEAPRLLARVRSEAMAGREAKVRYVLAKALRRLGEPALAVTHLLAAAEYYRLHERHVEEANLLRSLACVHAQAGELREALALFQRCVELDTGAGTIAALGNDLCNVAEMYAGLERVDEALESFEAALLTLRGAGHARHEVRTRCHLAELELQLGAPDRAAAQLVRAEPLLGGAFDPSLSPLLERVRSAVERALGPLDRDASDYS